VPICLQILHAGRYAKCSDLVGASDIASPINRRKPHVLTDAEVERTIDAFVSCAALAQQAGYDGVEIMASEGYLITQFTCPRTNNRTDRWGGALENRLRLPVEIVRRTRARVGRDFLIVFRSRRSTSSSRGSTPTRRSRRRARWRRPRRSVR
jgi:2,4-dienoyl-CoA reductase (NADPH2)